MSSVALDEHVLQLLRRRFIDTLPWLCSRSGAVVEVKPSGRGNSFRLVATWAGGNYEKVYDGAAVRALGRRGCARRLAELFVDEVKKARGEELDEE